MAKPLSKDEVEQYLSSVDLRSPLEEALNVAVSNLTRTPPIFLAGHFAAKKIAEEEKNIKLYKSILNSLGVDPNIVSEEGELTMTNQDMEILPYNCAVYSNISSTDESATSISTMSEESEL